MVEEDPPKPANAPKGFVLDEGLGLLPKPEVGLDDAAAANAPKPPAPNDFEGELLPN